jgi:hypothetical protein
MCTVYCYRYRQCGHRSTHRTTSCCNRSGGACGCDRAQIRELMQPGYCERLECQMERVNYEWSCCQCHKLRNKAVHVLTSVLRTLRLPVVSGDAVSSSWTTSANPTLWSEGDLESAPSVVFSFLHPPKTKQYRLESRVWTAKRWSK